MPFGPWEVFIILVILVVIFGAGRLSQVGGAMGKSVREFRGAVREEPAPAAPPPPVVTAPPVECPECHAANTATNRFCSACGATIAVAQAAMPVVAQAAMPAAAADTATAHDAASAPTAQEASLALHREHEDEDALSQHAHVTVPNNTCPSCATVNPPGQPFCGQCGTRIKNAA